jgi:hypothetical protein
MQRYPKSLLSSAVIHGPTRYGGLQYTDFATEQIASHVSHLLGNLRRNNLVGKTIQAAIDAYQIYLGTERPFFQQSPLSFPHRPSSRTSPLTYIWGKLHKIDGSITIIDTWTPSKQAINDSSIIDRAIACNSDLKGTGGILPTDSIWHINACRLYLRVTMIRDIASNPSSIDRWAFLGLHPSASSLNYPARPRPPPESWKIWRHALQSTFLASHRTKNYLPLMERLLPLVPSPTPAPPTTYIKKH